MTGNLTSKINGRIEAQSTQEWLYEYECWQKVWPATWGPCPDGFVMLPGSDTNMLRELPNQRPSGVEKYRCVGYSTRKDKIR